MGTSIPDGAAMLVSPRAALLLREAPTTTDYCPSWKEVVANVVDAPVKWALEHAAR